MPAYGQELYKVFAQYNTPEHKAQNKQLLYSEQWMKFEKQKAQLITKEYFNLQGLPDSILFFDEEKNIDNRVQFNYDEKGRIALISGATHGPLAKNEFEYINERQTIYVYLGDTDILFRIKHIVLKNEMPLVAYTIDPATKDTTELIRYNKNGKQVYSMDRFGADHLEQVFEWNEDNTKVNIFKIEGEDRKLEETHFYNSRGNLLKRVGANEQKILSSFTYDDDGKVTESFSFIYKNTYFYNNRGYLVKTLAENLVKEAIDKNLPEFIETEYKYQFR